jgi:hypothetical protein
MRPCPREFSSSAFVAPGSRERTAVAGLMPGAMSGRKHLLAWAAAAVAAGMAAWACFALCRGRACVEHRGPDFTVERTGLPVPGFTTALFLQPGDAMSTGAGSSAVLRCGTHYTAALSGETAVRLCAGGFRVLEMLRGEACFSVSEAGALTIRFPVAAVDAVRGFFHARIVGDHMTVSVQSGLVIIRHASGRYHDLVLMSGNKAFLHPDRISITATDYMDETRFSEMEGENTLARVAAVSRIYLGLAAEESARHAAGVAGRFGCCYYDFMLLALQHGPPAHW